MRDHRSSLGALMEHLSHLGLDSSVFVATNCISLIKSWVLALKQNKYTTAHSNNLCNR